MLLFLLMFADFTFSAPEGTWLDYARTGKLSENRYLVVQQNGQKGEYDKGARQIVLDQDGIVLYEVPMAENTWVLLNGILGDEDTFLFQNRDENFFTLWNPNFGEKKLTFTSDGLEIVPGSDPNLESFKVAPNGKKIFFTSKKNAGTEQQGYHTVLEILELQDSSVESLFIGEFQPQSFSKSILEENLTVNLSKDRMILHSPVRIQKSYLELELSSNLGETLPFQEKQTTIPHSGLTYEEGLLVYLTWEEDPKLVVELQDADQPLFVSDASDSEKVGYDVLREFAQTIGRGFLDNSNGVYSYQKGNVITSLDTNAKIIRQYQLENAVQGLSTPNRQKNISADHRTLTVSDKPFHGDLDSSSIIFELNLLSYLD